MPANHFLDGEHPDEATPRHVVLDTCIIVGRQRILDALPLRAAAHCTLHGVVLAILCLGPAVYRRTVPALRPGHEIVRASR